MRLTPCTASLLIGTALLAGFVAPATTGTAAVPQAPASELVYIGTHDTMIPPPGTKLPPGVTPDLRPGGKGIYAARLDETTGALSAIGLVATVPRPTWLIVSPTHPILYSVSELGNDGKSEARVYSLGIDPASGALHAINDVGSGGGGATHLAIGPAGSTVFVANFGNGRVSALPVNPDGSLAAPASIQSDYGTGPKRRQQGPHAHSVALDPSGRFLLSADLGADRIFVYRFDAATHMLSPATPPYAAVPPGSGPRHLVFTPDGRFLYMNTELGAEIMAFRWDAAAGQLQPIQTLSLLAPGYTGDKSAAELAVSHDGRFIYVSNRGEDTVVVFKVDAATGRLTELQRIAAGGKTPWSFSIDPTGRWMIVCNEGSSQLNVLKLDPATGLLGATGQTLDVPKPVSAAFYPN